MAKRAQDVCVNKKKGATPRKTGSLVIVALRSFCKSHAWLKPFFQIPLIDMFPSGLQGHAEATRVLLAACPAACELRDRKDMRPCDCAKGDAAAVFS